MDTLNELKAMRQLSELLMWSIVLEDIRTVLNSNTQIVRKEDFVSALLKPDGSERELKLVDSHGSWHKVILTGSGDTFWLRVRMCPPLYQQLELPIGYKQVLRYGKTS